MTDCAISSLISQRLLLCIAILLVPCSTIRGEVCASPSAPHSAINPQSQDWREWIEKHERYCQQAQEQQPQLAFLGDSITEGWAHGGRDVWDRYYESQNALNLGIAGDRTQHVLWRIENGLAESMQPDVIVLLIGTNNLKQRRNTVKETFEGIEAVVASLSRNFPDTHVVLLGILPCGHTDQDKHRTEAAAVNQRLRRVVRRPQVSYLDVSGQFVEPDGMISKTIMRDYLHLTAAGYERLAAELAPVLAEHIDDVRPVLAK